MNNNKVRLKNQSVEEGAVLNSVFREAFSGEVTLGENQAPPGDTKFKCREESVVGTFKAQQEDPRRELVGDEVGGLARTEVFWKPLDGFKQEVTEGSGCSVGHSLQRAQERKQRDQFAGRGPRVGRRCLLLDKGGSHGDGEEPVNSGCILNVESPGLSNEPDSQHEADGGVKFWAE